MESAGFDTEQADIPGQAAPVSTEEGVLFTFQAPEAQRVQIAGDFNSWEPAENEMEFSNGVWRTIISLTPGKYKYRYVVDGDWRADPLNPEVERSPFGDYDSVIDLE